MLGSGLRARGYLDTCRTIHELRGDLDQMLERMRSLGVFPCPISVRAESSQDAEDPYLIDMLMQWLERRKHALDVMVSKVSNAVSICLQSPCRDEIYLQS